MNNMIKYLMIVVFMVGNRSVNVKAATSAEDAAKILSRIKKYKEEQKPEDKQDRVNRELIEWAKKNNLVEVQKSIDAGANVNAKGNSEYNADISGYTSLMYAAINNNPEMVQMLLKAGVNEIDTKITTARGMTPLMRAALHKNPTTAKILIDAGANVNAQDYNECTPLMYAAINNNRAVVELLLNAGADKNLRSRASKYSDGFIILGKTAEDMATDRDVKNLIHNYEKL